MPPATFAGDRDSLPARLSGCAVDLPDDTTGVLLDPDGHPWELSVRDGHLDLWLGAAQAGRLPDGEGTVVFEGLEPVPVSWGRIVGGLGRCVPERLETRPATAWVEGVVHLPDDRRDPVFVAGCGGWTSLARPADERPHRMAVLPAEPCEVWAEQAGRRHGLPVEVTPVAGGSVEANPSATPVAIRWSGFDVVQERRGLRLVRVFELGPFRHGDLLLAVDGAPLDGPDAVDTLAAAVNPSGARHTFVVDREGEQVELVSDRLGAVPATRSGE